MHQPGDGHALHQPVLVLNASYEPINVCAARRAIELGAETVLLLPIDVPLVTIAEIEALAAAARPVDQRTALVIAAAIEGMALRSGLAPSEDGLRALVKLTMAPYGQNVRGRAAAALGRRKAAASQPASAPGG